MVVGYIGNQSRNLYETRLHCMPCKLIVSANILVLILNQYMRGWDSVSKMKDICDWKPTTPNVFLPVVRMSKEFLQLQVHKKRDGWKDTLEVERNLKSTSWWSRITIDRLDCCCSVCQRRRERNHALFKSKITKNVGSRNHTNMTVVLTPGSPSLSFLKVCSS
jgi:hypothetical protein